MLAVTALAALQALGDVRPKLDCSVGPIERTFGNTPWLVYACSDRRSVVVVSKEGNSAGTFVFILSPDREHYRIDGEGNGSKQLSDAALMDLQALGDAGIAALGDAARAVAHSMP